MPDHEQAPDGKPPEPPKTNDNVITTTLEQLKTVVRDIVDDLIGEDDDDHKEGDKQKPDPDAPKTDRETEKGLREQVAAAVAQLDRERAHEKEHEQLKQGPPKPPEPEVKPWRHKVWGERG